MRAPSAAVALVVGALIGAAVGSAPLDSSAASADRATATEPPIYAGLAASLINACARGTGTHPTETTTWVTDRSWSWWIAHEGVRGSLWQPEAAIVVGRETPGAGEDRSARAVGACMDALPLDWSLARAESLTMRRALYPYYRDVLIPCLRAHTAADPHLPPREAFLLRGLSLFDPYRTVHVYSADTARRLQAACPPAPRSVLVPAALAEAAASR